jgi:hypothetical protein
LTEAKRGAKRLLGCYRAGDANDPETYIAAVVSVLSRYHESVIRDATEPATGLPSRLKWLPSISEIREECERLDAREKRLDEFKRIGQAQIAARPKQIAAGAGSKP